jgi:hypothetical protein
VEECRWRRTPKVAVIFGMRFANRTTLYVADEGDGGNTYDPATSQAADGSSQAGGEPGPDPARLSDVTSTRLPFPECSTDSL